MKKLYRKGTVHPSPPIISDHLAFLPAAIITLTAALSPEDREVLAYLISFSASNSPTGTTNSRRTSSSSATAAAPKGGSSSSSGSSDHPPQFNCDCFRCYTSYWVRWGSSPNRELIHEIIDAFEDELLQARTKGNKTTTKKERRKQRIVNSTSGNGSDELMKRSELINSGKDESPGESESVQGHEAGGEGGGGVGGGGGDGEGEEEISSSSEKGSVRRFVSFIGERIWGVWG